MTRLLVCLFYFFNGQRILPWVSGFGAILYALGVLIPGRGGAPLLMIGAVFLAGFPILVGGLAYRQLVGNRRIALVPGLRYFATGGLFLLALGGAALAGTIADAAPADSDPLRAAQLAFAAISLYLLTSQWLVTHRAGAILFIVVPFMVLRLSILGDREVWESLLVPWAWLAISGLAWLWLVNSLRGNDGPGIWLDGGIQGARDLRDSQRRESRQLGDTGPVDPGLFARSGWTTAAGTLVRGTGDSWIKRGSTALMVVLMFPVLMTVVVTLMGLPAREPEAREFGDEFFLTLSLLGSFIFPAMLFAEWPIRMRMLWLRVGGERTALWQRTERMLLLDLVLVAAVVACVAAGFLIWSELSRELIGLYLAGAVLASAAGGYFGFLARISGWNGFQQSLMSGTILITIFASRARLQSEDQPLAVFWLLPLLAALALSLRGLARSRFRRMDWCKVRPLRLPRRLA